MVKEKQVRFKMDTAAFVTIWRNHLAHPVADSWKTFVLNCFERFAAVEGNHKALSKAGIDPNKYEDADAVMFLSEKCYAKCMTIKSRLKKDESYDVELPDGYLTRSGGRKSTRIDSGGIKDIFEGI